jgi:hypothetical protein
MAQKETKSNAVTVTSILRAAQKIWVRERPNKLL